MPAPTDLPPAAIDACACGRLRRATRAVTQYYDDALGATGLSVTQYSLLSNLARGGTVRISDFAARYLVDRTALARMLEPLVERGYVEVARGRDARTREASITRKGRAVLDGARAAWRRAQAAVERRLGPERLGVLIATLADLESLHPDAARTARRKESP